MNCNISGEVCEIPVISPFGHVFEKNLIEKHIKETGKCPVTEQSLKIEDMIQIKPSNRAAKPRPPTATSLASLLKLFQNQWDSTMLETFTLKKQFESVKQELSNSLYQYDAACRVIARLIKERDEAKQFFAKQ
ncbi:hypothetical protein MHBO_002904 [Bonamia ostreae]|uniref:Pre-mRNA-processing factor 19 n=1 Tax=Bonamia ostreae TaxID=126728 RepID=A0ABV2ANW7_9EUKA